MFDAGSPVTNPAGLAPAERTVTAFSVSAPHLPAEDPWLSLGAKPKWATRRAETTFTFSPNPGLRASSSTPSQEPWSTVIGKRRGKSSPQSRPPCELQLENRFNILGVEKSSPLQTGSSPPPNPVNVSLPGAQGVNGPAPGPLVRSSISSSRRKIMKEAALRARRSSGLPHRERSCEPAATAMPASQTPPASSCPTELRGPLPPPRPLFPPTTTSG